MLRIEINDRSVLDALLALQARTADLTPVMQDIGEHLTETTKRRFDTSTGPDGERWAPNTQTTILRYLGGYKGSYTKAGKLSSKGADRVIGKKPLIGESRSLMSTINHSADDHSVEIGSPMVYAAVQQFGAKAKAFGRAPWGDIPPRPFLGVSESDQRDILDLFADYLLPD